MQELQVLRKLLDLIYTVHFKCANVLDELPKLNEAGEKYDVVILDPPAFTKSREATKNAIKGYREINMKGLKLVKDGGYLASCSCSHFRSFLPRLLRKPLKLYIKDSVRSSSGHSHLTTQYCGRRRRAII